MLNNFESPQDAALVKGDGATYSQSKILVGRRPRQKPWLLHREVLNGRSLTKMGICSIPYFRVGLISYQPSWYMLGSSERDYVGSIFPCSCLKRTHHLSAACVLHKAEFWVHAKTNQSTCLFRANSMSTTTRSQSGMSRSSKLLRTFGSPAP